MAQYLVDKNATKAAKRAGYSAKTANQQGSRLLANVGVKKAIDKALASQLERVEVKADDILRELLRILRTDIGAAFDKDGALLPLADMPLDLRRAVSSIETDELFEGFGEEREQVGVTRKLKFWDKTRAAELLGKHLKLWTDKIEHSGEVNFADALKAARARAQRR